jgi:GTP-binding protein
MIVSEVPGTTRDSVDVQFELDGKTFIAIDTPGLRRSKSVKTDVDFYGARRAERSIRRADVTLMFFDAEDQIGKVDKQLCGYVSDHYKPCIFVVNKWDLLRGRAATEDWANYLHDTFRTMIHVPVAFITGRTGKNIKTLINHAQMLFKQSRQRITTGQLNGLVEKALARHPPPLFHRRRPKIYYAAQVGVQPPTIVMMCNDPGAFTPEYRRYLLSVLRDELPFGEVPIRLYFRKHGQTDQPHRGSATPARGPRRAKGTPADHAD